jgi:hypothetical protein
MPSVQLIPYFFKDILAGQLWFLIKLSHILMNNTSSCREACHFNELASKEPSLLTCCIHHNSCLLISLEHLISACNFASPLGISKGKCSKICCLDKHLAYAFSSIDSILLQRYTGRTALIYNKISHS